MWSAARSELPCGLSGVGGPSIVVCGTGQGARGRLALRVVRTRRLLIRVDGVCARARDATPSSARPRRARSPHAGARRRTRSGRLEVPRREPDAELLLDADDYLKLQQRRLRAGDRRGAARCYLEARKAQLKAHSQSVEKGAPPRVRLVSYSTKRRGRANAPWARRIFDATALDHPAFSATPENRAAMMMGILPSRRRARGVPSRRRRDSCPSGAVRRYAAGWSHEDVARARSSTPSLVTEPEPVQLRNREVVRKAPRSRVDDITERKTSAQEAAVRRVFTTESIAEWGAGPGREGRGGPFIDKEGRQAAGDHRRKSARDPGVPRARRHAGLWGFARATESGGLRGGGRVRFAGRNLGRRPSTRVHLDLKTTFSR